MGKELIPTYPPMTSHPIQLAYQEVTQARDLLQALIASSEAFDSAAARAILQELDAKVRRLSELQETLYAQFDSCAEERIVPFPGLRR